MQQPPPATIQEGVIQRQNSSHSDVSTTTIAAAPPITITTIVPPAAINKKEAALQATPIQYRPRRTWLCCTMYKDRSNFQNILQELDISEVQKQIIKIRYLSILENYQRRARNYSCIFFTGHLVITVGSLLVPSLLSIQNSDKSFTYTASNFSAQIYWTTFVISVLVTTFNGILTLFKVDKKYYFLHTHLERLRSEGWQYFSLTGRYAVLKEKDKEKAGTHINQFVQFIHFVEKIKMKQVQEEYYKAEEKTTQAPGPGQGGQELYPLSPDQPLNAMSNQVPDPVQRALNSIIMSQDTVRASDRAGGVVTIPSPSQPRMERRDSNITNRTNQTSNTETAEIINEENRPYNSPRHIVI
jgi:hypothetical protein